MYQYGILQTYGRSYLPLENHVFKVLFGCENEGIFGKIALNLQWNSFFANLLYTN